MTKVANKDEALRCLRIARQALRDNDIAKAKRFAAKARKLCDCAEVSAFLAELGDERSSDGNASDGPSTSTAESNDAGRSEGLRQRGVPPSNSSKTPSAGSTGSGRSTSKEQKELVDKILRHKDFYEVLGVAKDADEEEIKRAYKKLALKLHPDKNKAPKAEDAFKAVSRAFSCLSDAEKRENYDKYGHEDRAQAAAAGHGHHGMHNFYAEELDPHELFNMFFGGGFPHPHGRVYRTHFRTGGRRGHPEGGDQSFNFVGLMQVLPLLVLFMYTFFSGPSEAPYKMSKDGQFSVPMHTKRFDVPFYVKSRSQFDKLYPKRSYSRAQIELQIEALYRDWLESECYKEKLNQRRVKRLQEARGKAAVQDIELTHCIQLKKQFMLAAH